jgi:hypothetical protein
MRFLLTIAASAAAIALPATATAGVTQHASGQGGITIVGELRTFSFNAETHSDGTTTGHAELINRFGGNDVHMSIDCLRVIGNVASISGQVTKSNNPLFLEFSEVVFSVQDNGEGAGSPADVISFAFFDLPQPGYECRDQLFPPAFAIENGNVQVKR